jgi:hypothetical protein
VKESYDYQGIPFSKLYLLISIVSFIELKYILVTVFNFDLWLEVSDILLVEELLSICLGIG